jgi:hypothetical protein
LYNDKYIGLQGESYKELARLSQGIQKAKMLHDKVSFNFLTDIIFDWMKEKYKNTTDLSMTEYVLAKCEESIEELEIWIPIAKLYIQSDVRIGYITLKTITKDFFDHWRVEAENENSEIKEKIKEVIDREQKKLQGIATATIKIYAEPIRAFEIALEETEKSIALLRFFSASNFYPGVISYCTVLGKENLESTKHWVMKEGKLIKIITEEVDNSVQDWVIDNSLLSMFKRDLEILSNLIIQDDKTEFQEKLLDSLMLYSRSSLAKNLTDKLVYTLVALESILLKNENESIQQNIGERMAFLIGKNISERKSIIERLKKAYEFRSAFLHHGRAIDNIEVLKKFMIDVWGCFIQLIHNAYRFKTKGQLIDEIEERKLR